MIARCCRDTLTWRVGTLNGPPVLGTEIPCRWDCECYWRYEQVGEAAEWVLHDPLSARISKMVLEIASPEYQERKAEVLGKKPD